jgi:hypothetical protein
MPNIVLVGFLDGCHSLASGFVAGHVEQQRLGGAGVYGLDWIAWGREQHPLAGKTARMGGSLRRSQQPVRRRLLTTLTLDINVAGVLYVCCCATVLDRCDAKLSVTKEEQTVGIRVPS